MSRGIWRQILPIINRSTQRCVRYTVNTLLQLSHPGTIFTIVPEFHLQSLSVYRARLPPKAEWEYAARSGGVYDIWTGGGTDVNSAVSGYLNSYDCNTAVRVYDSVIEPFLADYAWFCGNADTPEEVGQKNPNGFNLYDMYGNLYEWTGDVFSQGYPPANYTETRGTGRFPIQTSSLWVEVGLTTTIQTR